MKDVQSSTPIDGKGRKLASRTTIVVVAGALWLATIAFGFVKLEAYKQVPGAIARPAAAWPATSVLEANAGGPTIIMIAHPYCPCTRATLNELTSIMDTARGRARAYVLFVKPSGTTEDWATTTTWKRAKEIPFVTTLLDRDGVEANKFVAFTSGQTLMYDRDGRLLFNGGLTPSRGHEGPNAGRDAVLSVLRTGHTNISTTKVFGCALFTPKSGVDTPGRKS